MEEKEILKRANQIAEQHNLTAEIPEGIRSVGVGGDERSYTPVIILKLKGPFPGWDIINKISTEITNTLPINRVTLEI